MGIMQIMGGNGDTRVAWNKDNADEVAAARTQFDTLRGKGFLAFKVTKGEGEKGEQVNAFDPLAERLILSPPMRGGR